MQSNSGYTYNSDDSDFNKNSDAESFALNDTPEDASSVTSGTSKNFNKEEEAKKRILIFNLNEQFGDEDQRISADITEIQQIFIAIGAESAIIKRIFRAGDFQPNSPPRRIHVFFESERDRQRVLENASKLKNILKWINVALVEYTTQEQRIEKKNRKQAVC
uniref:Uncharacterized protein n=1 Tax=Panagrolaimus superbus TaxID=310955 RepID=A0A914XTL3_9BILA